VKLLHALRNVMVVSTFAAATLVAAKPPVGTAYDTCGSCTCTNGCAYCPSGACCCVPSGGSCSCT
jgi:hypothetical protein